jgi:hypothetical protein
VPIGYVIGKVPMKTPVERIDTTKLGGRTKTKSIAISHPDADLGPSSRSAIAAGAASKVTAVSTVQMRIRTGNSFMGSGSTLGASSVPKAGHGRLEGKNPNRLGWMRGAVRIDHASQAVSTSNGETNNGISTPVWYTGTQFIAFRELPGSA